MSPIDIGLIAFAILAWLIVGIAAFVARLFGHDEVFDGVNPGIIPPDPERAPRRRLKGVEQEYAGEVAVAFSPPRGVKPGALGTVVDGSVDSHDLTATIVDLAVRGHLTISAVPADQGPHPDRKKFARRPTEEAPKTDWVLTRGATHEADPLDPHEEHLLRGLFASGDVVRMSQLDKGALQTLREVQQGFYSEVVRRGWYHRHPRTHGGMGCLPIVVGVVVGALFVVAGRFSIASFVAGALVLLAGVAVSRVTRGRTPRTALGSAVRIQGLGFKHYLATAEAGQFSFEEAAGIFSRYLPYAMVLGVAQHWAKTFADVARDASAAGLAGDFHGDLLWFSLGDAFTDVLFWDSLDGDLDMIGGLGELGAFAADGIGGAAEGLGDFLGSLDFLDGIGDGCGDFDGCGDA